MEGQHPLFTPLCLNVPALPRVPGYPPSAPDPVCLLFLHSTDLSPHTFPPGPSFEKRSGKIGRPAHDIEHGYILSALFSLPTAIRSDATGAQYLVRPVAVLCQAKHRIVCQKAHGPLVRILVSSQPSISGRERIQSTTEKTVSAAPPSTVSSDVHRAHVHSHGAKDGRSDEHITVRITAL